jgi:putative transposase
MPRRARFTVPGLPHHVTQRGNRRERTFFSDGDYYLYKKYLAAACADVGTALWAWCLMPNHVHLVLIPSSARGLGATMGRAHARYTRALNAREDWVGHLWHGRFYSFVMDEPHLLACARYVELNPVRAGLAKRAEDWPWSSARAHLGGYADGLTDPRPLLERWPDWQGLLDVPVDEDTLRAIRGRERNGRPWGDEAFLERLGLPRSPFVPGRRGRPPKAAP